MTDDELKSIEKQFEAVDLDAVSELRWIDEQLTGCPAVVNGRVIDQEGLYLQRKQLKANFKLARFLRDDARSQALAESLKRLDSAIDYLERRKKELS